MKQAQAAKQAQQVQSKQTQESKPPQHAQQAKQAQQAQQAQQSEHAGQAQQAQQQLTGDESAPMDMCCPIEGRYWCPDPNCPKSHVQKLFAGYKSIPAVKKHVHKMLKAELGHWGLEIELLQHGCKQPGPLSECAASSPQDDLSSVLSDEQIAHSGKQGTGSRHVQVAKVSTD